MSASTMPTEWPRAARATARLVVTLDLPTPPLPDEMNSGRVREPGWANGIARPSAWPWAWLWTWPWPVALQLDAQRLALLVAHHREVDGDAGDAVEGGDGAVRPGS